MFAEYIIRLVFMSSKTDESSPVWAVKIVALICIWLVIIIQSLGSTWGIMVNNTFTALKVTALVAIASIGILAMGSFRP